MLPWRAKIAAKMLLSRLPIPYGAWRRVRLFKHGAMDDPEYALSVFERHFRNSSIEDTGGFIALELGPGDSVGSALIAKAFGASRCYLVDVGRFATEDMAPYKALANLLRARGHEVPDLEAVDSVTELLAATGGDYLTTGLASLRGIPDASVDFAWSHAVLEHVAREDFDDTMRELRRVLRADGTSSHRVDLEDHLAGSLNNLRFPRARWESPLFKNSGFYTNRLRCGEIVRSAEGAGLKAELRGVDRWDRVPIQKNLLDAEFRNMSEIELLTRGIDLVLVPSAGDSRARAAERSTDELSGI
jgi:SAM-dependent methyltransferase